MEKIKPNLDNKDQKMQSARKDRLSGKKWVVTAGFKAAGRTLGSFSSAPAA
jgi:hypothetical protein